MAPSKKTKPPQSRNRKDKGRGGGLKGFFERAGHSFYAGGAWVKGWAQWGFNMSGKIGFIVASTSFVTLLPLIFEISREQQMLEAEKSQVKDLKAQGYSDRQLQEMGFCEASYRQPSVAAMKS